MLIRNERKSYQMNEIVSIIIPVYQVEKYLDDCLESIIGQSYGALQVILIDNGSMDGSGKKCDEWAKADNRIEVYHQNNMGLAAARNSGLALAKGKYILFVDSDDRVDKTLVEKAVKHINLTASDIVFYNYMLLDDRTGRLTEHKEYSDFPAIQKTLPENALGDLFAQRIQNYAWMHLVKKELYDRIGFRFPVGRTMEDMATTFSAIGAATGIGYIDEPLYFYRVRGGSISNSWNLTLANDAAIALRKMVGYTEHNYPAMYGASVNYAIKFMIWSWAMLLLGYPKGAESLREELAAQTNVVVKLVKKAHLSTLNMENKIKYLGMRTGALRTLLIVAGRLSRLSVKPE